MNLYKTDKYWLVHFPLTPLTSYEIKHLLKNQNMAKITVQKTDVTIQKINDTDYISLTDIAKYKTTDANAVIANWLRNRMTIEYLGLWEILYNPHFKPLEFEGFKKEAGLNAFTLSPQDRLIKLNQIAIQQMSILEDIKNKKLLK